jgi:YgiT-type zinc finger domain-containing protein
MKGSETKIFESLIWALEASGHPAMFAIFYENIDIDQLTLEIGRRLTSRVALVEIPGGDLESSLRDNQERSERPGVDVVAGALSALPANQRAAVNASRDRILELGTKLVFIEPMSKKYELYRDFPDLFSVVRSAVHISGPAFEDDHLFDNSPAWRLSTIACRLPQAITRGATLIHQGVVHSKDSPRIECPKCGEVLVRGTTQITFTHAPEATRIQRVSGWVCPCGEAYVPGEIAQAAHRRAFSLDA